VTPNPGFKVTGYLKVEYLADGATVFNVQSTWALPKTCKKLGVVVAQEGRKFFCLRYGGGWISCGVG